MADISDASLDKIARFCEFQRKTNPAGIGNECTHVVYAALYEVDATDGASDVNRKGSPGNPTVQTSRSPYRWGREINSDDTKSGDIVQFENVVQIRNIYSVGQPWRNDTKKRLPHHTSIIRSGPLWGSFDHYEAHIKQDGYSHMQVRINTVFYETFSIMLKKSDLPVTSNLIIYIKQYMNDTAQLMDMVNWGALRRSFTVTPISLARIQKAFASGESPAPDAAIFFRLTSLAILNFIDHKSVYAGRV